jgi:alpha-beta hydrolase superfamily lysophospholipase
MKRNKKNSITRWVKWIAFIYAFIGLALYFLQHYFLFHPVQLARNYQYHFNIPFKEIDLPVNKTDTINMVKFFPVDSLRKGVVIYFHGNRGNINRYAKFAANFTKHGYEVWMEDYPGFGKSTGSRNEKILYQQAVQIYAMAAATFSANNIVVYGKSFGTGIAAYLASTAKCRRLILETPYYSIPDLFGYYAPIYPVNLMADYKIPSNEYLAKIKVPVTIFHGTADGVIPYRCAAKLKTVLKTTDQFITIENGTHHNLNDYPLFHQKLDSLLMQ